MRPRVLTILMGLYALFGIGFLVWTVLGAGAGADATFALPLPAAAMLGAGAVNLAIAFGIRHRVVAMRWLAVAVHVLVAAIAVIVTGQRVANGALDASTGLEMAAKCAVHAALAWFWLRSNAVVRWFGPPPG